MSPKYTTNTYLASEKERQILIKLLQEESDRFIALDSLGSGGFGSVVSVYDKWLKTNVALKVSNDPNANLETDILRLRSLPAQYFVRPFDFGKSPSCRWYSMELLRPEDDWHSVDKFNEIMDNNDVAIVEAALFALFIVKEICFGLSELHKNKITGKDFYHGDIKPANVFFNFAAIKSWRDRLSGPQGPYVKIIDLGASNECGRPSTTFTDGYAAPEQLSSEACSHEVDAYAVIMLLWELLDLSKYGNPNHLSLAAIRSRLKQLSQFFATELDQIVHKSSKENPKYRFSCEHIGREIADLFDLYLEPAVWRMIRHVEKQDDRVVRRGDLLKAMERELIYLRFGKTVSAKIKNQAKYYVQTSSYYKILYSAGHGLLTV